MVTLYDGNTTLGEIVNGARRHEAGAFRSHEYPQTLPEPDDIQAVPSRRGTRCRRRRTGITLELVESRLKNALRHLDNS